MAQKSDQPKRGRPRKYGSLKSNKAKRSDTLIAFDLIAGEKKIAKELAKLSEGMALAEWVRGVVKLAIKDRVILELEYKRKSRES